MPSFATPRKTSTTLWATVVGNDPTGKYDTTSMDAALAKEYPDQRTRILRLMAWYGSGDGPWSGFPAYESLAEQMLLEYPTSELVASVVGQQFSEAEMEGAARLFGSWDFGRIRPSDSAQPQPILSERSLSTPSDPLTKISNFGQSNAFGSDMPKE